MKRAKASDGTLLRLSGEISELAVAAPTYREFYASAAERLCETLGFDAATVHHTAGTRFEGVAWRLPDEPHNITRYMRDFEEYEFAGAIAAAATLTTTELFTPARFEATAFCQELLAPSGAFSFCTRMWRTRDGGIGWYTLIRSGRAARYGRRELEMVDAVAPALIAGAVMHACSTSAAARVVKQSVDRYDLSRAEADVAALAARGLTNKEIATLLRRSAATVRNQLAAVYRKLGVTNRTELAFVFVDPERGTAGHAPRLQ